MGTKIDLTGHKYGHLLVLRECDYKSNRVKWHCLCDCGKECDVQANNLRSGNTTSCGCMSSISRLSQINTKHGIPDTHPVYVAWVHMKARCYTPTTTRFDSWGGRGITVCDEWKNDFKAFYDWSMENGWQKGLSLDRIDNDGMYCPANCRWVNNAVQCRNKRNNIWLEFEGKN